MTESLSFVPLPACEITSQEDLEINSAIPFLGLKKGERTKDFLE